MFSVLSLRPFRSFLWTYSRRETFDGSCVKVFVNRLQQISAMSLEILGRVDLSSQALKGQQCVKKLQ